MSVRSAGSYVGTAMIDSVRGSGNGSSDGRLRGKLRSASRVIHWSALSGFIGLAAVSSFGDEPAAPDETAATTPSESDPVESIARIAPGPGENEKHTEAVTGEIHRLFARLESAGKFLRETNNYAARFTQQVHKNDRLREPERMLLKIRHEPFAVFMQWERDGQQALYVKGQHEDKLLVHPTRGIGRLRRLWVLEPDSGLAMRGSLRPVTEIGMLNMVDMLLGFHHEHILQSRCVSEEAHEGDRRRTRYCLTFDTPEQNPHFAKTYLWLCDEHNIPLRIENYSWTDDNRIGPLLESYDYSDVTLEQCSEADFDRDNEAYSF